MTIEIKQQVLPTTAQKEAFASVLAGIVRQYSEPKPALHPDVERELADLRGLVDGLPERHVLRDDMSAFVATSPRHIAFEAVNMARMVGKGEASPKTVPQMHLTISQAGDLIGALIGVAVACVAYGR